MATVPSQIVQSLVEETFLRITVTVASCGEKIQSNEIYFFFSILSQIFNKFFSFSKQKKKKIFQKNKEIYQNKSRNFSTIWQNRKQILHDITCHSQHIRSLIFHFIAAFYKYHVQLSALVFIFCARIEHRQRSQKIINNTYSSQVQWLNCQPVFYKWARKWTCYIWFSAFCV